MSAERDKQNKRDTTASTFSPELHKNKLQSMKGPSIAPNWQGHTRAPLKNNLSAASANAAKDRVGDRNQDR